MKNQRLNLKHLLTAENNNGSQEISAFNGWCVYLLELNDHSLYCGIAAHLAKRLLAHQCGKGSRIVRAKLPFRLVYVEPILEGTNAERSLRSIAQMRESAVKKLSRAEKLQLIEKHSRS